MIRTATYEVNVSAKFGIDTYAAVRNNIRSGANRIYSDKVTVGPMKPENRHIRRGSSPVVVNDLFRVQSIVKIVRLKSAPRFAVILSGRGQEYEAIGGPPTSRLALGESFRIRGCLLKRQATPLLVICSLSPVIQQQKEAK